MRILYVISELTMGGAQKQLVELARQLATRGHEVTIYTLNADVPRQTELQGSGVNLIVDQKQSRLDLSLLRRLRRTVTEWRPDIVHGFLFDGDFYSRVACLGTGIPVLNSERSDSYHLSGAQRVAHRLTRGLARGVVANTYAGGAFAQKLFGIAGENIHVVYNGVRLEDLESRAAAAIDYRNQFFGQPDVRVACFVGAIKPAKDFHLALATAARLIAGDPRWRVLMLGEQLTTAGLYKAGSDSDTGEYKAEVLRHHQSLGMPDKIKFGGLRTDVPAIMRQCDALYVTSVREGFPNVVLEAMALGVPVVSTEYSDIRRILPFAWQVVASRQPDDIAAAIIEVTRRNDVVAARQRQWVWNNATIEGCARALENVYQKYSRSEPCPQTA